MHLHFKKITPKESKQKKPPCRKAKKRYKRCLSRAHRGFEGKLERRSLGENSGGSDGEKRDMCECGKVLNGIHRAHPHTLLSHFLKSCIITLDLSAHSIDLLEWDARTVNGKTVIVGKSHKFGAASVFLAVEIILMGASTGWIILGVLKRTAIFLA